MNRELKNYIEQSKKSGTADEQIKQELLGAGWAEKEVSKALNPGTNSIWKFVIPAIIIIGIIGGGVWYWQNKSPEDVSENIIDCGISENELWNNEDLETDSVLVCLGESMVDCKTSKAVLTIRSLGQVNVEVRKGDNQKCIWRMEFGDIEGEPLIEYGSVYFSNKYVECPLDMELLENYSDVQLEEFIETPGAFAKETCFLMMMNMMAYPEGDCTGSLYDFYIESVGKPTPEEALAYAADSLEAGNTEEFLKMHTQSAQETYREILDGMNDLPSEYAQERMKQWAEEIRSSVPVEDLEWQSESYKIYERTIEVVTGPKKGDVGERTVQFSMEKLPNGNWAIGD